MNTQSRAGKIARLPHAVREELNRRMEDGEAGVKVLAWLNGLPEVQAILRAEFGGKAIGKQNLWAWRHGGYRDWVMRRDAMELALRFREEAKEIGDWSSKTGDGKSMVEMMVVWVTAQFGVASRHLLAARGEERWKLLRQMWADVDRMRRGEISGRLIVRF